jgi:outer membrane protein OmpA-like peptidoglycan-associated protein
MFRSNKVMATLLVALALTAGCTQSAPQSAAPKPGAEQAGAWYQIYFETGGSDVKDRAAPIITSVARLVAADGAARVTVIGKTDRVGAPPANSALSRRRADAVRDALIAAGVPAASIVTSWTGEARQQMATANEVAEQGNRVVDITVLKLSRQP